MINWQKTTSFSLAIIIASWCNTPLVEAVTQSGSTLTNSGTVLTQTGTTINESVLVEEPKEEQAPAKEEEEIEQETVIFTNNLEEGLIDEEDEKGVVVVDGEELPLPDLTIPGEDGKTITEELQEIITLLQQTDQENEEELSALSAEEEIEALPIEEINYNEGECLDGIVVEDGIQNLSEEDLFWTLENILQESKKTVLNEWLESLSLNEGEKGMAYMEMVNENLEEEISSLSLDNQEGIDDDQQEIMLNSLSIGESKLDLQNPTYYLGIEDNLKDYLLLVLTYSQNRDGSFGYQKRYQIKTTFDVAYNLSVSGMDHSVPMFKKTLTFLTSITPQNNIEEIIRIWAFLQLEQTVDVEFDGLMQRKDVNWGLAVNQYFRENSNQTMIQLLSLLGKNRRVNYSLLRYLLDYYQVDSFISNRYQISPFFSKNGCLKNWEREDIELTIQAFTFINEFIDYLERENIAMVYWSYNIQWFRDLLGDCLKRNDSDDFVFTTKASLLLDEQARKTRMEEFLEQINQNKEEMDLGWVINSLYLISKYNELSQAKLTIKWPAAIYGQKWQSFWLNYLIEGTEIVKVVAKNLPRGFKIYFDQKQQLVNIVGRGDYFENGEVSLFFYTKERESAVLKLPVRIFVAELKSPGNWLGLIADKVVFNWQLQGRNLENIDYVLLVGRGDKLFGKYEGKKRTVIFNNKDKYSTYWYEWVVRENNVPISTTRGNFHNIKDGLIVRGADPLVIGEGDSFESRYRIITDVYGHSVSKVTVENLPEGMEITNNGYDLKISGKNLVKNKGEIVLNIKHIRRWKELNTTWKIKYEIKEQS